MAITVRGAGAGGGGGVITYQVLILRASFNIVETFNGDGRV